MSKGAREVGWDLEIRDTFTKFQTFTLVLAQPPERLA